MKKIVFCLISVAMTGFTSCDKEAKKEPSLPFGLPGAYIVDMAIDNNNMLYFVTGEIDREALKNWPSVMSYYPTISYLSRKSEESGKIEILDDRYLSTGKICFDKNNHFLTYDDKSIYKIDGGIHHKIFELPDINPYQRSLSFIAVDNDNNIWAGGLETGLYKIDDTRLNVTHYHEYNSELPTNNVRDIHIDKDNNIWIVTGWLSDNQWILKISNEGQWTVYKDITSQNILCLVTDKNGHLWIGTGWDNENQSLMRFDGTGWETVTPRNDKNETVEGIVRYLQSDGRKLYVVIAKGKDLIDYYSYSHELLTFDGDKWNKKYEIPEDDWIGNLFVDNYRKVLWVWTLSKGLFFKIPF